MVDLNDIPMDITSFETNEEQEPLTEDLIALAAAANTDQERQRRRDRSDRRALRYKTLEVAAAIASVAVVYLIVGLVEMNMSATISTSMTTLVIGALYIGLAYWARLSPLRAATAALVLFGATFAVTIATVPPSAYQASHFVVVALLVAFVFARQHRALERHGTSVSF